MDSRRAVHPYRATGETALTYLGGRLLVPSLALLVATTGWEPESLFRWIVGVGAFVAAALIGDHAVTQSWRDVTPARQVAAEPWWLTLLGPAMLVAAGAALIYRCTQWSYAATGDAAYLVFGVGGYLLTLAVAHARSREWLHAGAHLGAGVMLWGGATIAHLWSRFPSGGVHAAAAAAPPGLFAVLAGVVVAVVAAAAAGARMTSVRA